MSFHPSYNNPGAPGTIEAYETFAKQQKFKAISVTLKSGGEGYWFGPPTATKLILYFPGESVQKVAKKLRRLMNWIGGAYSNPASEGFFLILSRLVSAAREGDVEVAVFALSYGVPKETRRSLLVFTDVVKTFLKKRSILLNYSKLLERSSICLTRTR